MDAVHRPSSPELLTPIDRRSGEPLHAQIERALRDHIRSGTLAAGARLPSTRALARDLGVARGVVTEAYAQLGAEGWLDGRRGAGTVVAEGAGGAAARIEPDDPAPQAPPVRFDLRLSSAPDFSAFPREEWLTAARSALVRLPDRDLGYGDPRGMDVLRRELAAYLGRVRAVQARPASTLICNGTVQGLGLVCRAIRARGGRRIAIEDPGWPAQRSAVERAGMEPVPLPVDGGGMRVELLAAERADAAIVTPANQFPTGVVLAPERRHALIEWAEQTGGTVVEDDYDAEYRYDRSPTGSLQGLAPDRVAYAGSVSKTLAPALRMGWLVLPAHLAQGVAEQKRDEDRATSALLQAAFAEFLARGGLDRHLRRMRLRYRRRRDALCAAVARRLPELEVSGIAAGLHVVALLPRGWDEAAIAAAARERGLALSGLAGLCTLRPPARPALLLGYSAMSEEAIPRAVKVLGEAIDATCAR